jgi:uncharacterized protein (TIGR02265 family)
LLRTEGLNLDRLEPEYSLELYHRALDLARDHYFPQLSPSDGDIELGRRFIQGYQRTLVGSILIATLSKLPPEQILDRFPRHLGVARTDSTADVERLGPRSSRVYYRAARPRPYVVAGTALECLAKGNTPAQLASVICSDECASQLTFTW